MIKHILFDLDETLYPTATGLMLKISQRMNEFMIQRLGVPESQVNAMRQSYWQQYGTTLRGLYTERHIDPLGFLDYVHDVRLDEFLKADARLDEMLGRVKQDKYIFTNAPADYARRVLKILGIERHFRQIFDIHFIEFDSKPAPSGYAKVLAALGAQASECLMIEDSARNLVPARALGMRTILLDGKGQVKAGEPLEGIDQTISTIYDLIHVLEKLEDSTML